MKRYIKYKFRESIQSEQELKKLSDLILKDLALQWKENLNHYGYLNTNRPFTVDMTDIKGRFKAIKNFINSGTFWITKFKKPETSKEASFGGYYTTNKKTVTIILHEKDMKKTEKWNNKTSFKRITTFINFLYSETLLHELTHAYDDYISKGKFSSNDYTGFEGDKSIEGNKAYYNQNIEVNARYSQIVNQPYWDQARLTYNWKKFLEEFKKDSALQYKLMSPEQQKRIINRLWKRYNEPIKDKKAVSKLLNDRSFRLIHNIRNGKDPSSLYKLDDKRLKDKSLFDLKSYVKETLKQLQNGQVNKKEIKDYSIDNNRYTGFQDLKSTFEMIDKMEEKMIIVDDKVKPSLERALSKYKTEIQNMSDYFNISIEDLKKISNKYALKV